MVRLLFPFFVITTLLTCCISPHASMVSGISTKETDIYFRPDSNTDDGSYLWLLGRHNGPLQYLVSISEHEMDKLLSTDALNEKELSDLIPDIDCCMHIEFHSSNGIIEGLFLLLNDEPYGLIYVKGRGWIYNHSIWNTIRNQLIAKYNFTKPERR